jgi:uncharacterized protein
MARKLAGEALSSGGQTDLRRLLETLSPRLDTERFTFATTDEFAVDETTFALIREDEAVTHVRADPQGSWARITLTVQSSLEAVGLTASVASALGERGIPANIIAAAFHDHLFVPWDRREDALQALRALS